MLHHRFRSASATALLLGGLAAVTLGCFNDGQQNTTISATRFEVATGSVVLGARQLLVDTSNGDVWMLEGDRAPNARWVLLVRGPEDAREPETGTVQVPLDQVGDLQDKLDERLREAS
jgi:hypothetical protein